MGYWLLPLPLPMTWALGLSPSKEPASFNYNITFVPGTLTVVPPAAVSGSSVAEDVHAITGSLLFNDGKGSVRGDIYTMSYPELVSLELKRTLNKISGAAELNGLENRSITCDTVESKEMTLDNITVGLSSHLAAGMTGAESFAAGSEITVGNTGNVSAFTFKEAVKLPRAFFGNGDENCALANDYDIPVVESVEVAKVAAFKSEIEKLIDEMLM